MKFTEALAAMAETLKCPVLLKKDGEQWVVLWGFAPSYQQGEPSIWPNAAFDNAVSRALDHSYPDEGQTRQALARLLDDWRFEGED